MLLLLIACCCCWLPIVATNGLLPLLIVYCCYWLLVVDDCLLLMIAWLIKMSCVRKDVEDSFGILKKRFTILRVPSIFNKEKDITNVFKTCCLLHNMLFDWDGLSDMGHDDADWIAADKRDPTDVLETIRKRRDKLRARNPNRRIPPTNSLETVSFNLCQWYDMSSCCWLTWNACVRVYIITDRSHTAKAIKFLVLSSMTSTG